MATGFLIGDSIFHSGFCDLMDALGLEVDNGGPTPAFCRLCAIPAKLFGMNLLSALVMPLARPLPNVFLGIFSAFAVVVRGSANFTSLAGEVFAVLGVLEAVCLFVGVGCSVIREGAVTIWGGVVLFGVGGFLVSWGWVMLF